MVHWPGRGALVQAGQAVVQWCAGQAVVHSSAVIAVYCFIDFIRRFICFETCLCMHFVAVVLSDALLVILEFVSYTSALVCQGPQLVSLPVGAGLSLRA